MAERQFRSVWTTTLATLRWTNISPGSKPTIWFAGTRLSEHPIHRYCGACWRDSRLKKSGSRAVICSAHARLFANSWLKMRMSIPIHECRPIRLQDQLGCRSDVGNDPGGNPKLCSVLHTMAGENVDRLGADGVTEFRVRRMIPDDKRSLEIDSMIALCELEKIRFRLH